MREHVHEKASLQVHGDRTDRSSSADGDGINPGVRDLRLGAKGLITARGRVLLIQEQHADGSPFWTIPGGGLQADESLSECLRRELVEEIRCAATVGEVLNSYLYAHTSRPVTTLYAVFETTLDAAPDPNADEEVMDHAWRTPGDLPPATLEPVADMLTETMRSNSM